MEGVGRFLGRARTAGPAPQNLLCESLTKKRGDPLHINDSGRALLVSLIKQAIMSRRKGFRDSRGYASVTKAGGKQGMTS